MFSKVLVANRGEIAVRAFRAATELGAKTVAVFPYEDRKSEHRLKADEAYQIGDEGHPIRAYLSPDEIVRVARESGADAVYPGYGFLSENPDLAEACSRAGVTFVGPPAAVLHLTGNKARAIAAAKETGMLTLMDDVEDCIVPDDLAAAFDRNPGAREHWESWSASAQKLILSWIVLAKRPETRAVRISTTAEKAAQGIKAQ